jgi:hypothetical protein
MQVAKLPLSVVCLVAMTRATLLSTGRQMMKWLSACYGASTLCCTLCSGGGGTFHVQLYCNVRPANGNVVAYEAWLPSSRLPTQGVPRTHCHLEIVAERLNGLESGSCTSERRLPRCRRRHHLPIIIQGQMAEEQVLEYIRRADGPIWML